MWVGVFTDCNYTLGCPSERTSDVSPSLRRYLSPGASVPSALHRAFPPRATRLCIAAASRATPSKLTHMSRTRRLGAEGEGRWAKGKKRGGRGGVGWVCGRRGGRGEAQLRVREERGRSRVQRSVKVSKSHLSEASVERKSRGFEKQREKIERG